MKTAQEMYPQYADEASGFYGPGDYGPIIESCGEVIVRTDDDDYQGDTYVLIRGADGSFGYLVIGWGSCSGCDALQACSTFGEIDELAKSIRDSVRWFDTQQEAIGCALSPNRTGDHYYGSSGFREFSEKVRAL